jgi:D-alanine-D-alanine ligase
MIERFVQGREFTCCVLGNTVLETLPIVEIIPNPEHPFFDYAAKYTPGASKEICPASISEDERRDMEFYAKEAHRVLRCSVWSRTDMILQDDKIYILETNTVPGMTATSLVPLAARAAGMSMSDLLDRLIEISLEGQEKT